MKSASPSMSTTSEPGVSAMEFASASRADRRLQPDPDLDDAGRDVDARRIDVSHHVEVGAHQLDREDAGVQKK